MDVTDRSSLPRRPLPRSVDELPPISRDFVQVLDALLPELGFELTTTQRMAIEDHARLLLAWNDAINLSGLRTPADVARGHVLDALVAVPALRAIARGRLDLLDIGSGGGYPGLPLAVALPSPRAALVDSIAKKAAFLGAAAAAAAAATGAKISALNERAEDLADEPDHRQGWDLVVARAVGTVSECAELGLPLARRHGHVVIWKRASDQPARAALDQEIEGARRIVQAAGGSGIRVVELRAGERLGLPGCLLVVIRKTRPTPDRYPRSPGERKRGRVT
jgi:16S rRNA (guanine527-N7)-methyltransferase